MYCCSFIIHKIKFVRIYVHIWFTRFDKQLRQPENFAIKTPNLNLFISVKFWYRYRQHLVWSTCELHFSGILVEIKFSSLIHFFRTYRFWWKKLFFSIEITKLFRVKNHFLSGFKIIGSFNNQILSFLPCKSTALWLSVCQLVVKQNKWKKMFLIKIHSWIFRINRCIVFATVGEYLLTLKIQNYDSR